jgi:hypothetical protein
MSTTVYERPVDKKATKIARARHQRGIERLQALLLPDEIKRPEKAGLAGVLLVRESPFGDPSGSGRPFRMRAGVPPIRGAFHAARHRRNKIANASRRRNRA